MRVLLALFGAFALMFTIASCGDGDDRPDDTPRTLPPTSVPSGAARPIIQGVGPVYEVSNGAVLPA